MKNGRPMRILEAEEGSDHRMRMRVRVRSRLEIAELRPSRGGA